MANQPKLKERGRVNLHLDQDIIDHFKHVGATEERPYQPLINKVLRDYIESLPPEQRYHNR
jgi:uncharacterized protein (DUF4415 family)